MSSTIKINREQFANRPFIERLGFAVDVAMILLVISNLALILFDWFFSAGVVQGFLARHLAHFHDVYLHYVHNNFVTIDLVFIAIYLTELGVRWAVAIYRKTHHRWFFYPFVHWYDVLGCIPVGSFRWLRVLRLVTLLHRMQRMGLVDLSDTYLGRTIIKYYKIIVEEVSDRVVINILQGAQQEVADGAPLLHRIDENIIQPRKALLAEFIADKIAELSRESHSLYHQRASLYLSELVDRSLTKTRHGSRLAAIPIAGTRLRLRISDTVKEVVDSLLHELVEDINSPDNKAVLEALVLDVAHLVMPEGDDLNGFVQQIIHEVLDEVIAQVAVKRWQQEFNES